MKNQKQIRLAALALEIAFLKQAIKAKAIREELDLTPQDRIRRLEQENYWLRRLAQEAA